MDKEACWNASEEDLGCLGLISKGDIIKLKSFSMPSDEDEHGLAESLKSTAAERTSSEKSKAKYNRRKIKTVHLGWMHYIQKYRKICISQKNK